MVTESALNDMINNAIRRFYSTYTSYLGNIISRLKTGNTNSTPPPISSRLGGKDKKQLLYGSPTHSVKLRRRNGAVLGQNCGEKNRIIQSRDFQIQYYKFINLFKKIVNACRTHFKIKPDMENALLIYVL